MAQLKNVLCVLEQGQPNQVIVASVGSDSDQAKAADAIGAYVLAVDGVQNQVLTLAVEGEVPVVGDRLYRASDVFTKVQPG